MVYGLSEQARKEIDKLINLITKHTGLVKEKTVLELFIEIVKDIGYEEYLLKQGTLESEESISYLNQFAAKIKEFQEGHDFVDRDRGVQQQRFVGYGGHPLLGQEPDDLPPLGIGPYQDGDV